MIAITAGRINPLGKEKPIFKRHRFSLCLDFPGGLYIECLLTRVVVGYMKGHNVSDCVPSREKEGSSKLICFESFHNRYY